MAKETTDQNGQTIMKYWIDERRKKYTLMTKMKKLREKEGIKWKCRAIKPWVYYSKKILIMNDGYIISQMLMNYPQRRPLIDILKER